MNAKLVLKFVVPILILALGAGVAKGLMSRKTHAEKKAPASLISAVEFVTVEAGSPAARVLATGTVEGDKQVSLSALVAGEVVSTSDKLVPGGRFRTGQTILRVDPRDYELAVAQEGSRVQQARLELSMEEQRGETAVREWALLGGGKDASEAPLALRGPQLEAVKRSLEAAGSGLKRAELNLERTTLDAPFNAMVLSEMVEVGQLLSPGAAIVTLVGTDRFRVKVSVPVEQLRHVSIPGVDGVGSMATVVQDLGAGGRIERTGRVMQLAGQLDPQTRTADLYVAIDDPLSGDGLPLLPGAFVTVDLEGKAVDGAIAVPRVAVVDGARVWTVSSDDRLVLREVTIGWQDGDTAFVVAGLDTGERVVVTLPALPVDGAQVRPMPFGAQQTAETPAAATTEG
jgi:RND family efflux transporter MFP subunit